MKKEITIYTQNGCIHCTKLKELLKQEKISFIEKNKAEHQEDWAKIQALTGLAVLPTLVIDGEHLIPGRDYNKPEQVITYIKSTDTAAEYPHELRLKEGFKTLTYSINQGFNRVFQELNKLNKNEHKSTD